MEFVLLMGKKQTRWWHGIRSGRLGIRRYLKTLDRNTKWFDKTRMKISRRSWCLYFEYFHKIENLTHNVIDLRSSPKKEKSLTLSLVMTKILRYLISRCHSFPQKYQNEKFRIDIKELNVQLKIESFIKRARMKSFSSVSRWISILSRIYTYIYICIYICICLWKNYEYFLKLILYNDFLWNRDFNFDIHFIN